MSIGHVILGVLVDGPAHGYAARRELARRLGSAWPVNQGQVYATLQRLVTSGRLTRVVAKPPGRRRTKDYALLPAGRRDLESWQARVVLADPSLDELHVKLVLLLERGDRRGALHLLERQREAAHGLKEALEAERRASERERRPLAAAHDLALALASAELDSLAELRLAIAGATDEATAADATPAGRAALSAPRSGASTSRP
jgi:DNA-binding PadR family transcriptional regulator